jgi:formate hydrogenlyase subunit 6/NADH:ubiquinone oxidoreductase subunit I
MPDDWSRKRIEKGYETARLYTEDILAGKSSWKSFPLLSGLMYYLCIGVFKITDWKIHQKYLHMKVETVKCNSCGICAEFCPANNIQMEQYPVHGFKCQYCLRCASVCPQGAIPGFINYKKVVYKLPDNSLEELLRHDE